MVWGFALYKLQDNWNVSEVNLSDWIVTTTQKLG